jgi:ABC-type transport system involved in multi-copper enzyme maturation permease subunit
MKFLAILKDSLRETIDTKVFFVVLAISLVAVLGLATLTLQPDSPEKALKKLTDRFPDGSNEIDLPILGRIKATPPLTEYAVLDLKEPPNNTKPWEAEYQFVVESRDKAPLGGRVAILRYMLQTEDEREHRAQTGRRTRGQQIGEEVMEEARRIQEREQKKGGTRVEIQARIQEQVLAFVLKRLEDEVRSLKPADMEEFVKDQLENQGNWRVEEVKKLDLPPEEGTIKLEVQVPLQEGEDVRITKREAEGEVNKFAVKVVSRSGTYRLWPHKASLLFGAIPWGDSAQPGQLVYRISYWLVGWVGAPAIMLLSCIITAFFIPNMLRKGSVDLLLAKPISRVGLLVYKFLGGLTFMFVNTAVLILGLWVVLGLRSGIWEPVFLLTVPVLTFQFALFYALSTLAAVWTRSPIVCILACILMWVLLFGIGEGYWLAARYPEAKGVLYPEWAYNAINGVHASLPRYVGLLALNDATIKEKVLAPSQAERERMADENKMFDWPDSLLVTGLYVVLLLGVACWRFAVKDY